MSDVVFLDRSGNPIAVPEERAAEFEARGFQREGFDAAVSRGVEQEQRNKADDFLGGVDAFGRAGARVLTAGLSDFALDAEESKFLRDEFSTADTLGSLTGIAAGLGAAGLGAGGVGTATVGRSALGGFGGLATRAATGAASGLKSPLARLAVEGAIESAAFEAAQVVSDVALTDDPMTVESVVSRIGSAAALGGGLGGALGAGFKIASKIPKPSKALLVDPDVFTNRVRDIQTDGVAALKSEGAIQRRAAARAQQKADELRAKFAPAVDEVADATVKAKPGAGTGRGPKPEAVDAVRLYEEALQEVGTEFRAAQDALEKARLDLDDVNLDKVVGSPKKAAQKVAAFDAYHDALERIDELTGEQLASKFFDSDDLQRLTKAADAKVSNDLPEARTPVGQLFRDAYGAGHVLGKVEEAKRFVGARKVATEAARGAASGLVFGAPGRGALLAGASAVVRAAAGVSKVRSAIGQSVAKFIKGAASRPVRLSATAVLSGVSFGKKDKKESDPVKARVTELRQSLSGGGMESQLDQQLAELTVNNPALSFKVADQLRARLSYYLDQAPQGPQDSPFHTPRWQPPAEAVESWARVIMAGEQPVEAMDQMLASGRVDPVTLQTIQDLYPNLFEEYRAQFLEQFAENPKELPYEKRLFLTQLFGAEIEPTADPQFVTFLQQRYMLKQQEQQPQGGGVQVGGTPQPEQPTKGQRLAMR